MRRIFVQPLTLGALAVSMLLFAGCESGPRVHADYDKSVVFSQYTNFAFENPLGTDSSGYQSLVSQYLKAAMRRELEARGLRYVEESPQLLVNFNAKLSDKLRTDTVSTPGMNGMPGYYGYRRGYYSAWPMYTAETTVSSYTEGTLNIDVVDATRKQMVWEGVAVGSVTEKTTKNLQAAIDTTVAKIMKDYPVAAPATGK